MWRQPVPCFVGRTPLRGLIRSIPTSEESRPAGRKRAVPSSILGAAILIRIASLRSGGGGGVQIVCCSLKRE